MTLRTSSVDTTKFDEALDITTLSVKVLEMPYAREFRFYYSDDQYSSDYDWIVNTCHEMHLTPMEFEVYCAIMLRSYNRQTPR